MLHKNRIRLFTILTFILIFSSSCTPLVQDDEEDRLLPEESVAVPEEKIASKENTAVNEGDKKPKSPNPSPSGIVPTQITIPSINVDAKVEPFGLDSSGAMEVPEDGETVAWFEPGTKPGSNGNAVFAAHVDDYTGPAVFFDLKELNPGDEVHVNDGERTLTFVVTHKEAYPYNEAPLRKIYGPSNKQRLNLITCTGLYDRKTNNHEQRLVVYTELKET